MAIVAFELLYVLGGLAILWLVWRALEWGWLRPRRLGRAMRAQGLRGTAFRFPSGDLAEETRLLAAQRAKPLPQSSAHDITARVQPLVHKAINEHGKISMIWQGPTPGVILSDPKLVREVLANKVDYRKHELPSNFVKLIGKGLLTHEGEKWAVHRKIINPAFHLEKLKKMVPAFTNSTIELMDKWEDLIGSDANAKEIDVWPEFQDLTGDAISRAAFGSNLSE
ncbi:hypothetical protein HU200_047453 [Digitaria exilis]|uniref:Cytochrome P450 n=1 Tax=Digitaria exilis TaxID=1010633 RepID=A0A835EBS0_9POAL|nr:hypothetical protein HU200_047453 [Digitaria exilis]CAB3473665.1 unnamed protein product [Digitaria exilis]